MGCLCWILSVGTTLGNVSIDDLIREREFGAFNLSPDGKSLAFTAPVEGFRNIFVIDLETMNAQLVTGEEADVDSYFWANNSRLVYSTDGANRVYNGLYAIDKNGENSRVLIEPIMTGRTSAFTGIPAIGRLYSENYDEEDWIVVTDNSTRRRYPDLIKLNVYDGKTLDYFKNPADFTSLVDDGEIVRMAFESNDDGSMKVYYRPDADADFRLFEEFEDDWIVYSVVGFDEERENAYILTNHLDDTISLYRVEFDSKTYTRVFSDPDYDLSQNVFFSPKTNNLLGLRYEKDRPAFKWFNSQIEQLQGMLDEAFPDTVNIVIDADESLNRMIVSSFSDRQPPVYRLLTINPLGIVDLQPSKPWIKADELPSTKPVSFSARDGRKIHGYLTLPKEYEENNPVPLVVLPHGGPWARDVWGFRSYVDTLRIFPATRGWAVLEVNFRGSTGYGNDHLLASFKEPHQMNHDVEDGVKWAVEEGYADPEHLGIMGASWGGYATMYGITMTPDLYRFGINIFGVVDLAEQINWYRLRTKWGGSRDSGFEIWANRMGNPDLDEEKAILDSASPINFIDRITADLLIYHGTEDVNVDIAQSRKLRRALKRENIDFKWISKADEHHTIRNFENRKELYLEIEKLLKKHGK